jgi:hypothetical protein
MTDLAGLSYYELILDSRDASYTYDSAYSKFDYPSFELGGKLRAEKIAYMKVLEASIPFSYFTINADNSDVTLVDTTPVNVTFNLTPGTFDSASLITELQTKLNTATTTGFTYVVTFDPVRLAFTISNGNAVPGNTFSLTFSTAGIRKDTLATVLGFPAGVVGSSFVAGTNKLVGGVSELLGSNFVYINSNAVGNEVNLFLPRGSNQFGNGGPQMAMVPTTSGTFGDDMIYQDPCHQYWFNTGKIESLTKIDLFISDGGSQEVLRFNGRSFSVKIGMMLADSSIAYGGGSEKKQKT